MTHDTAVGFEPADELGGAGEAAGEDADELLGAEDPVDVDGEFAPHPRRRLGKGTVLLVALLVAGVGFLGGVEVQKHHGNSTGAGGFAARLGNARQGGEGFAGGAGGFAGRNGGTGTGAGTGAGAGAGAGNSGATSTVPTVIGTVVSVTGDTLIVQNFAEKLITVTLSSGTTVTKTVPTSALAKGETVTVIGTTGSDGKVAATSVGAK